MYENDWKKGKKCIKDNECNKCFLFAEIILMSMVGTCSVLNTDVNVHRTFCASVEKFMERWKYKVISSEILKIKHSLSNSVVSL